jgi:cell division protein FtsI (penicillin-binding protein 3)
MEKKKHIIVRFGFLYIVLFVISLMIIASVLKLQIVKGEELKEEIEKAEKIKKTILANRGNILASDGRDLACSIPSYRVHMDTRAGGLTNEIFNKYIKALSKELSKFYGDKSAYAYEIDIRKARRANKRYFLINPKKISYTDLQKVKQFPLFNLGKNTSGFIEEQFDARKKPFGMLASRTIGSIYDDKTMGGYSGLEKAYDNELRGIDGTGRIIKVPGRRIISEDIPAIDGKDIITTINIELQDITESALLRQLQKQDARYGVAILMEVQTGEIKAIANLRRTSPGVYEEVYNYAIGDATEPGSTFKLASIIAALEDGVVSLDDTIDTGKGRFKYYDRWMTDSHHGGYGKLTVREVFEKSSNIGVSKIIYFNYKNDPKKYVDRIYSMGLNEPLGIEIPGEGKPVFKYPGSKYWWGTTLPWMSIGYETQMTPLQILAFYNAVANNGVKVKPMFVKKILDQGEVVKTFDTEVLNPSICSRSTIEKVHELLKGVVEHGTARNIKNSSYKIAGKTGTAQIAHGTMGYHSGKEHQASFVGYFPADEPVYSCIVVVNSPSKGVYYGGTVAGTVFKEISDKVFAKSFNNQEIASKIEYELARSMPYTKGGKKEELLTVFDDIRIDLKNTDLDSEWLSTKAREYDIILKPKTIKKGLVPNVKGMGAKDAIFVLENAGLRVRVTGAGKVRKQSLTPGGRFRKGQQITLTMG